ncbi:hypothetical protein H632_c707p2, partial [Helicosporidium sp. ATCC 50920]
SKTSGTPAKTFVNKERFDSPLGDLELQFESNNPAQYTISKSMTLRQILGNNETAEDLLARAAAGEWISAKAAMKDFAPESAPVQYDRITLGWCLQNFEACAGGKRPSVYFCMDRLVMVTQA